MDQLCNYSPILCVLGHVHVTFHDPECGYGQKIALLGGVGSIRIYDPKVALLCGIWQEESLISAFYPNFMRHNFVDHEGH